MCKEICGGVLGVIFVIVGLMGFSPAVHKWVLVIAGLVLLIKSFCHKWGCCDACNTNAILAKKKKR